MSQRSRSTQRTRVLTLIAGLAIVLSACTSAASPSPQSSVTPEASASPGPSAVESLAPTPLASEQPSQLATPEPTQVGSAPPTSGPTPKPVALAAGWSKPALVGPSGDCGSVAAGIDSAGRFHVTANCAKGIVYAVSSPGGSWTTTTFASPANRTDLGPQLEFDGNVTYLAYYQVSDGGCGGPVDTGVYYRMQTTPGGAWSIPTRIGVQGDGLEAFRESGGTLYAAVVSGYNTNYFESIHGDTIHRYSISDAWAGTFDPMSLRLGSDGKPRIAYTSLSGIRYGVFNGSGFTTATIVKQDGYAWQPNFVLDPSNNPHLLWTHSPPPGGCASRDPSPKDGTYYATNASGAWTSARFTTDVGDTSIQIDNATGQVYALVTADEGLAEFTMSPSGGWTPSFLTVLAISKPLIRRDPASGRLLVAFVVDSGGAATPGIYTMTTPGS